MNRQETAIGDGSRWLDGLGGPGRAVPRIIASQPRRFVAEGNFVLVLTEGDLLSGPTALYDLFRVKNGKIVEHWEVLAPVPPRDQWKNSNGPF